MSHQKEKGGFYRSYPEILDIVKRIPEDFYASKKRLLARGII